MRKLQEIEKKYEEYESPTPGINNLEDFLIHLQVGLDDTVEYEKDFQKEIRENKWWKLEAMVRNFFFFLFAEEEVELYDEDNDIVMECIDYTRKFREFYERIQALATEENFRELLRLVDFSTGYYSSQMDYYDYLRDRIEYTAKGIFVCDPRKEDTRKEFYEFMEKRLKKIEQQKKETTPAPQYVKKG